MYFRPLVQRKIASDGAENLLLFYMMAQRDENDDITLFNDELIAGSLSMTSVLVRAKS